MPGTFREREVNALVLVQLVGVFVEGRGPNAGAFQAGLLFSISLLVAAYRFFSRPWRLAF